MPATETAALPSFEELVAHPDNYPVDWCTRCEVQIAEDGSELCLLCEDDEEFDVASIGPSFEELDG